MAAPSPSAALAQYLLTCTAQLGALTRLVRGPLPDLHRQTLAALITLDVHARDIVDNIIRSAAILFSPPSLTLTATSRSSQRLWIHPLSCHGSIKMPCSAAVYMPACT